MNEREDDPVAARAERVRLPEILARHVAERPDQPAIRDSLRTLSYAELDRGARRLAARLTLELGVGGDTVAILLEHGADLVEAVLGIAYAGKTYVSLYPEHPDERLSGFLRKAGATTLVTSEALLERAAAVAPAGVRTATLEALRSRSFAGDTVPPLPVRRQAPLYILFTSGSTGDAKGLVQTEPNALAHAASYVDAIGIAPGERYLLTASSAFDAFVLDLYGGLIAGATLCLHSIRTSDARGLLRRIVEDEVATVHFTPSVFRWLLGGTSDRLPESLRRVVLGGEPVRPLDLETFRARSPESCELINLYGLTECSLVSLARLPRAAAGELDRISIGAPVPGVEVELIDDEGQRSCVAGELVVRSGIVAAPLAPRENFVAGVHCTGDRARRRGDGTLEMLGRRDHQVKVRGQRVELGTVESALRRHPDVREAAVIPRSFEGETAAAGPDMRLVAFFVPEGHAPSRDELVRHLEGLLAQYEIPSVFTEMSALPSTISGKVDRQALMSTPLDTTRPAAPRRPPRTAIERRLTAIWERLFPGQAIGCEDDFFALGGHSLLALDLVGRIENEFGRALELTDIFKARTLEAVASLLEGAGSASPSASTCTVPIAGGGGRTPLFCIHCGRGRVHHYVEFARELEPDRPIFGLQPPGMDGHGTLEARVEAFAERYAEEIRAIQPAGPYFVCGYSFGGLVAVEVARRLTACGESVEELYIIDTSLPRRQNPITPWRAHRSRLASLDWPGRAAYVAERIAGNVRSLTRSLCLIARRYWSVCLGSVRLTRGRPISTEQQGDYFFYRFTKEARARYTPRPYHGDALLFRATRPDWTDRDRRDLGWGKVVRGNLDVVDIESNHATIMAPENARRIARAIRQRLEQSTPSLADR